MPIFLKIRGGNFKSGFTLIELAVIVGVLTLLTSLLVVYTRSGENQIKILKDKAAVISALYRARSLSLRTTYAGAPYECGYGFRVLNDYQYVIWRDLSSLPDCSLANKIYDGDTENFGDSMSLSSGIVFGNTTDANFLKDILFIPPDPLIVTIPPIAPAQRLRLAISTLDEKSSTDFFVNRFGQIEPSAGY